MRLDLGYIGKDLYQDTAAQRLPLPGAQVLRHHPSYNYKGQRPLALGRGLSYKVLASHDPC
jgi:hypothetical protein